MNESVIEFVNLLVSSEVVTLSDYEKFYGASVENELFFELKKCREMGWEHNSNYCVSFIRERWSSPENTQSLYFLWIKKTFSTPEAKYKIISSSFSVEGFEHLLVEVMIGRNNFLLFHNASLNKATGMLVGISSIDGRSAQSFLLERSDWVE